MILKSIILNKNEDFDNPVLQYIQLQLE